MEIAGLNIPTRYLDFDLETFPDASIVAKAEDHVKDWQVGKCLLFVGEFGRGKTVLATNVLRKLIEIGGMPRDEDTNRPLVSWWNSIEILARCKANIENAEDLIEMVRTQKLLLLDDLGAERPTPYGIECLYRILDHRHGWKLSTIITTNLSPAGIEKEFNSVGGMLGGRLASRLKGWADVIELKGKDLRLG